MAQPWWVFVIIPVLSALVGYGTNVLAIVMTFSPLKMWPVKVWQPKGSPIGLFGWQGIVPAKADKIIGKLLDLMLAKLLDVEEIFGRVDPDQVMLLTAEPMRRVAREGVDSVTQQEVPHLWSALPAYVKAEVYDYALKDVQVLVHMLMERLKAQLLDVWDAKAMVTRIVVQKPELLVNMFHVVGHQEFRFLERSGFVFGMLFGLVQSVVYYFYNGWWVLIVAGFLVGWVTNSIAIFLIFRPASPVSVGPFRIQGVFLKRQAEVADLMGKLTHAHFMQVPDMFKEMLTGVRKEAFLSMLRDVVGQYLAHVAAAPMQLGLEWALDDRVWSRVQDQMVAVIQQRLLTVLEPAFPYMDGEIGLEDEIRGKVKALQPEEFVGVLRPAFQEDELKLIAVGGVLGAVLGAIQQYAIFGPMEGSTR